MQLNRRIYGLVNDELGNMRQICCQQPYPFTVSNLADFHVKLMNMSFVLNINNNLIKENSFYNFNPSP